MKQRMYLLFSIFAFFISSCHAQDKKKGIALSEVEGMAHIYGKKKYNTFSGKWTFKGETTWLLLKNGWALKNPKDLLSNLHNRDSVDDDIENWSKWKEDEKFEGITIYAPSPSNARYDLSIKLYSVGGSPVSSSVSTKTFTLMPNGRFETSVFRLAEISTGGTSTRISKSKDKEGGRSTTIGTSKTGIGEVSHIEKKEENGKGNMSGTYRIDGHTIELKFDNGLEKAFLFATDGQKAMILDRDFYFRK